MDLSLLGTNMTNLLISSITYGMLLSFVISQTSLWFGIISAAMRGIGQVFPGDRCCYFLSESSQCMSQAGPMAPSHPAMNLVDLLFSH